MELFDRRSCLVIGGHFDEAKAFRSSGVAVFDNLRRFNRSGLSKQFLEVLTGGLESEVSHIKFFSHINTFPLLGMKRSYESDLTSANGGIRRIRFGCSQSRAASSLTTNPLSNHPNVRRYRICAGRITVDAREKDLTPVIMPINRASCKLAGGWMATPALSPRVLIVRGQDAIYALGERKTANN